jgi:hypothetical protein
MTARHAVCTVLAATHLTLATIWAFEGSPPVPDRPLAKKLLRLYGTLSGAENQFGFFAPDVGWQVRSTFALMDAAGRTWTDTHERGPNRECELRLGNIADTMFALDIVDEEQIHSWAAAALGRHPTAETCVVRIDAYHTPTMAEFRAGKRPEWVNGAELTYTRTGVSAVEAKARAVRGTRIGVRNEQ